MSADSKGVPETDANVMPKINIEGAHRRKCQLRGKHQEATFLFGSGVCETM